FGKGPTEKDPNHGHLAGGLLHSEGAGSQQCVPATRLLSPLLANVALSVLDEHFAQVEGGPTTSEWVRRKRRQQGQANYRLIRYADDFLVMVSGDREHADQARDVVAAVLAPMGLRLSEAKTMITHVDEGLDFLGWRIQRHRKRGTDRRHIYTYLAKKALRAVMAR
ncbi:reverse transcriptase domain-containing protein, partial [Amycolatopsis sp. NPDC059090]|uniref:reverse transcriptase domain-containing protein n=1 Tax=Amycolatopsis sp. NPDC059090 TaxID=3346723 RepID=UPI00366EF7ED